MTLLASKKYLVTNNLVVPEGLTLTIEPGTEIIFSGNTTIGCFGCINIKGTPEHPIRMHGGGGIKVKNTVDLSQNMVEYCYFENAMIDEGWSTDEFISPFMKDCIFDNCIYNGGMYNSDKMEYENSCERSTFMNCKYSSAGEGSFPKYSNIANSFIYTSWEFFNQSNFVNYIEESSFVSGKPFVVRHSGYNNNPSYIGTSDESKMRSFIYDLYSGSGYIAADLSNVLKEPVREAHGIIWKVCVNGKDAQDEYEDLAPLGVGKQKFEVYFNRPMNKAVAPLISFGVRDPWTQNAVAEDGSWNEEGTIYTAYKTINGRTKSDGINRIYVHGAEDNEYFECPYEKTRFNFMINAAGSMATGFAGEAKMGRVELTWNNENNDFDDAMGFNIYRYSGSKLKTIPAHYDENNNWIEETQVPDTICINKEIVDIETTEYTDYDVIPGTTYYYMYKVLSTDLKEYDVSNVVAVTPLTSELGDARRHHHRELCCRYGTQAVYLRGSRHEQGSDD